MSKTPDTLRAHKYVSYPIEDIIVLILVYSRLFSSLYHTRVWANYPVYNSSLRLLCPSPSSCLNACARVYLKSGRFCCRDSCGSRISKASRRARDPILTSLAVSSVKNLFYVRILRRRAPGCSDLCLCFTALIVGLTSWMTKLPACLHVYISRTWLHCLIEHLVMYGCRDQSGAQFKMKKSNVTPAGQDWILFSRTLAASWGEIVTPRFFLTEFSSRS